MNEMEKRERKEEKIYLKIRGTRVDLFSLYYYYYFKLFIISNNIIKNMVQFSILYI